MTCALTGHRVLPKNFDENRLFDDLEELIKAGCDKFICGMAMGFDLACLACLVALRQKYQFTIEACVPFNGQENTFPPAAKAKYRELIAWCDVVRILYPEYREGCYLARNRFMVDRADLLYAYCSRERGGTAYTVNYAKKKGIEVRFYE